MTTMLERYADLSARLSCATDVEALAEGYFAGALELVHVHGLGFDLLDPKNLQPTFTSGVGVSDYFLARYESDGRAIDPVLAEAVRLRAPVLSSQLMSASEWRTHPAFRDVFQLHEITALLQVPLVYDGAVLGVLNFGGRRTDIGISDQRMAVALARLVTSALVILRRREWSERERRALQVALDVCDRAVVVTDLAHNERRMNRVASELLAKIHPSWALDDELARARGQDQSTTVRADVKLVGGEHATLRIQFLTSPTDPGLSGAFLTLDDDFPPLPAAISLLLTRREGEVARLAASGLRNGQIAHELGLAPDTVKQYLKAGYRKLGVSSRVELARRLMMADSSSIGVSCR